MDVEERLLDVTDVVPDIVPGGQSPQQVDARRSLVIGDIFVDAVPGEDEHPPEVIRVERRVYVPRQR